MQIRYRRKKLHAGGSLRSLRLLESAAAAALATERARAVRSAASWEARVGTASRPDARRAVEGGAGRGGRPGGPGRGVRRGWPVGSVGRG